MLFISFGITDAIDILLVAIILYLIYNLVRGTSAINVFIGLALIYVAYIVVRAFDLKLLGSLLSKFVNVGVIAIIVLFQQEIRKFLLYIGSNEFIKRKNWKQFVRLNFGGAIPDNTILSVREISAACFSMSESKTGALLVISQKTDLKFYIQSGIAIDSVINAKMIENIFFKNSPLHDGAVVGVGHLQDVGEVFPVGPIEEGHLLPRPQPQHLAEVMRQIVLQHQRGATVQRLRRVEAGQTHLSARSGRGCARWR